MARRKLSRAQIAAGFGGKRRKSSKRRTVNGAKRKSSRRRRIGAAAGSVQQDVVNIAQLAVGALVGGMVIGFTEKIAPNYYVRAGGTAVVGLVLARTMPAAKLVGMGMASAGIVGIGGKLLAKAGVRVAGTLNAARKITPDQMREITAKLKAAANRRGIAGGRMTLNEGADSYAVRTLNYSGNDGIVS